MPCTITDNLQWYTNTNTATGISGVAVLAVPSSNTIAELVGGNYKFLSKSPNISNDAYSYGRSTTTDIAGQFSFILPYSTETHPSSPTPIWNIIFPDGRIVSGVVPAIAGPLLIDTLIQTYGWIWTAAASFVAPNNGVFAKGVAPFTAQDNIVINFSVPFATSTYEITLTPSLDTVSLAIPSVAYSSKSRNGFTINTSGAYTGAVDWIAQA